MKPYIGNYIKVFTLSFCSWVGYFYIDNSERLRLFQIKADRHRIDDGFAVFLTINLVKYFLLLFGIISVIFLIVQFFKKKK